MELARMPHLPFSRTLESPILACKFDAVGTPKGTNLQFSMESCGALMNHLGAVLSFAAGGNNQSADQADELASTGTASCPLPGYMDEVATLHLEITSHFEVPAALLHAMAHGLLMVAKTGWHPNQWGEWLLPGFTAFMATAPAAEPAPRGRVRLTRRSRS